MYQTCLYDYLDCRTDPLFRKLNKLRRGEHIQVDAFTVSFTVIGHYEILSKDIHEMYRNVSDLYSALNSFLNNEQFLNMY